MNKGMLFIFAIFFSMQVYSQENNAITCSDGIDNDGDGLIDCQDSECDLLSDGGCTICLENGLSFADVLIEYIPGPGCTPDPDPSGAIGVNDVDGTSGDNPEFVFLGEGGSIRLGFTNNLLTNSGDSDADLWVFEVGNDVESSQLELKPSDLFTQSALQQVGIPDSDGDGYYEFGGISGSTSSLDIDAIIQGYAPGVLRFDAVEIIDVPSGSCSGNTPGADIDAVCALQSIAQELCFNNIDDDGDGLIDEGCEFTYCEFDNGLPTNAEVEGNACINGTISVSEAVQLTPLNAPPLSPKVGTMYFDGVLSKLRVWDGNEWKNCW